MRPVEIEFLMRDGLSSGMDGIRARTDLLDASLKRIAMTIGGAFSLGKALEFGKAMMDVRGQMESYRISFESLLGSAGKGNDMLNDIKSLASATPLMLDDLSKASQMLLGFGMDYNSILPTLKQIGDVTMGNRDRFGAMSLAFAQMTAAGKLMGQDLMQMINAGFNPLKEMSDQTGKSVSQLKEEMSAGAISSDMVAEAFARATSEGGKFHGMLEKQGEGINGLAAQFRGAVVDMQNSMGEAAQPLYEEGVKAATFLVKNYETVGKAIIALITTYGAYRAAVIAVTVVEREMAAVNAMVAASNGIFNKGLALQFLWTERVQKAQALLNKTMLANPYVLIATAVVALGTAIWALRDATSAEEQAQKKLSDTIEAAGKQKEELKGRTHELISIIHDETQTIYAQAKAYEELKKAMPKAFEGMSREQIASMKPDEISRIINRATDSMEFEAVNKMFTEAKDKVARLQKQYDLLMSAPGGTAGGNGGGLAYLSGKIEKAMHDMDAAKRKLDEMNRIKIEAEFDARPAQEKISFYNQEIVKLEEQKRQIEDIMAGSSGIKGQWDAINIETLRNAGSLEAVNTKLNEMKGKLAALSTGSAVSINYGEAYNKAKRDWDTAKKVMADISRSRASYTKDQYDAAVAAEKTASTAFKDLGGDVKESSLADTSLASRKKEASKWLVEQERQIAGEIINEKLRLQQAEIDLMEEGYQKQLRQNQLNYEKEIQAARERNAELLREQEEYARKLYMEKNGSDTGFRIEKADLSVLPEGLRPADIASRTEAAMQAAQEARDNADRKAQDTEAKRVEKLLETYADYDARRRLIDKKYGEELAKLKLLPDNAQTAAAIAQLRKATDKELKDLQREVLNDSGKGLLELYLFGDGSDFIKDKIKALNPLFEDISKLTLKQLGEVRKHIGTVEFSDEQLATFRQAGIDVEKLVAALGKAKTASSEAIDAEAWKEISELAGKVAGSVGELGASLSKAGGAIGEIGSSLSGLSSNMSGLNTAFSKTASTGDKIGAGLQGIASIVSMVCDQIEANRRAQEDWNAAIAEASQRARMARIELEAYRESNLFGVENPYARAIAGARQYAASMKEIAEVGAELENGQVQTGTKKVVSGKNTGIGVGGGAAAGAVIGSIIPGLGTAIGAVVGGLVGGIIGLFSKKTVPVFESLAKRYGEIYNKETFELNPKILQDYSKLDAATKKLVDSWEEIKNKAKEAQEQMRANFADLAGDIGAKLSDHLVAAFRNASDAARDFHGDMTTIIEDIIEQLVFSQYFEEMFNQLEERFNKSFGEGGDGGIVDDLMWLEDEYKKGVDGYNSTMSEVQKWMKENGYNAWQPEATTQSGRAGAYEAPSQESVTHLVGIWSAHLEHAISIDNRVENIATGMSIAISHLRKIEENTAGGNVLLDKIEKAIESVRDDMATIRRDGIKTR
jgi:tape measure domain-containing protein